MDQGTSAIEVRGLEKRFGEFRALDGLDLTVATGEVHGLLGPNGAGKSTAIRVLLGLLRADAGTVRLLDGDPWRDVVALHRRLAYVPGDVSLWPGLTGGQAIDLLGNLRGGLDEDRRARLVRRFELDPTKRGRQYSKGNRQKVAIVAALSSDVELLVLDEPTSGLDPVMESVFAEEVAAEKARGRTVLLSSHVLSEVEALADRVSIIRDGRVVESGTLEDLRGASRVKVDARTSGPLAPDALPDVPGAPDAALEVSAHGDASRLVGTAPPDQVPALLAALLPLHLRDVTVTPPSLTELFLRHYETDRDGP